LQEQASNHLKLLWPKAMVVSVEEKVAALDRGRYDSERRAQANHSMRRRKSKGEVKTGLLRLVQDKFGGKPVYCLSGLRRKGGVNLS
jgi:hypothetical protein